MIALGKEIQFLGRIALKTTLKHACLEVQTLAVSKVQYMSTNNSSKLIGYLTAVYGFHPFILMKKGTRILHKKILIPTPL